MASDRIYVRANEADRARLELMAGIAKVPVAALLRETTLDFGPVWVANRAADRVAGRTVKVLRRPNSQARAGGLG